MIALFFIVVLNVWGMDNRFDIPMVWKRCLGVDDGVYRPRTLPRKLLAFNLFLDKEADAISLRDDTHVMLCTMRSDSAVSGGMIFRVEYGLASGNQRDNGFVFANPQSSSLGGILLNSPSQKSTVSDSFFLERSVPQEYFCEYTVGPDRLIVDRLLQQYADGSQYFVGITFRYDRLEKPKVSYGIKHPNGDGAMVTKAAHLNYDFSARVQAPSVIQQEPSVMQKTL